MLSYSFLAHSIILAMNFTSLPNLIALAILVAVFRAILRQGTTERLHLWLTGWILVLAHFAAQLFDINEGPWERVAVAVSLDTLALAGIAFLISVSTIASNRRRKLLLALSLAVPSLVYINTIIWDVTNHGWYYSVIVIGTLAPSLLFCLCYKHVTAYAASVLAGCLALALTMAWTVAHGRSELGINLILAGLYFSVALLFWRRYQRSTAGVLTTVIGFALWGAVFPVGILLSVFAPNAKIESEVWNIPKYLVAVGMILTLLEEQIERNKYLAYHDELTGLPNRRLLEDRLDKALAHAGRTGNKVAVLLLDLDRFKEVNDTYGHRIGDVALQEVVARLVSRIRVSDTLARSGGDEFTVISYVADAKGAEVLIAALESALADAIDIGGIRVEIGLSVGAAVYPENGRSPDELVAHADRAMYSAKRATRGSAVLSEPPEPPFGRKPYISAFGQQPS